MSRKYRQEVPDGQFHHRVTRTVRAGNQELRLGFEWHGGEYIEVCRGQAFGHAKEVINVWEIASDSPRIPRTVAAMEQEVDRWIEGYGPEDLIHDVTHNWN